MDSPSENFYIKGINLVQDYIETHLDGPLSVKKLAGIAAFSEFHFQRIYSCFTGETLYGFIKRLRLEKAAYLLLSDRERPITDIALTVGFSNQASFAKAFKLKYGINGSDYRKRNGIAEKAESMADYRKEIKKPVKPIEIILRQERRQNLIYLRYTGSYKQDSKLFSGLFQKLYSWADERELISSDSRWFVIYHDFGYETEEEQLRLSVCMSVEQNVAVCGDVGVFSLQEGTYAVGSFRLDSSEYGRAWYYMYTQWLPQSGYKPDERFAMEHYPAVEPEDGKRLVEIYVPIVK